MVQIYHRLFNVADKLLYVKITYEDQLEIETVFFIIFLM